MAISPEERGGASEVKEGRRGGGERRKERRKRKTGQDNQGLNTFVFSRTKLVLTAATSSTAHTHTDTHTVKTQPCWKLITQVYVRWYYTHTQTSSTHSSRTVHTQRETNTPVKVAELVLPCCCTTYWRLEGLSTCGYNTHTHRHTQIHTHTHTHTHRHTHSLSVCSCSAVEGTRSRTEAGQSGSMSTTHTTLRIHPTTTIEKSQTRIEFIIWSSPTLSFVRDRNMSPQSKTQCFNRLFALWHCEGLNWI